MPLGLPDTGPRRRGLAAVLLPLCFGAACARFGFSPGEADGTAPPPADLAALSDGGDTRADATTTPLLSCPPPTPAAPSTPGLREPTLQRGGLRLWARAPANIHYYTERPSLSTPFGPWSVTTEIDGKEDPSFFSDQSGDWVILAQRQAGVRNLQLCPVDDVPLTSCGPVTLHGAAGQSIDRLDTDGPWVFFRSGAAQMLLNVRQTNGEVDAHLATPTVVGQYDSWRALPIPALAQPGFVEDDPTISRDGRVIVFGGEDGGPNNLWYSATDSSGAWLPPQLLATLSSSADEGGPAFGGTTSGGAQELFFSSARSGKDQIYRTACQLP